VLAIDEDETIVRTLELLAQRHAVDQLVFANGCDRHSSVVVPESAVCEMYGIEMAFGVGGTQRSDSSTRINEAIGHEPSRRPR
jgi:hypothetical protein